MPIVRLGMGGDDGGGAGEGGGGGGGGFLCDTSWENSIFLLKLLDFLETSRKGI